MQVRKGRFDVVVAQYHDQGLNPLKYLGLEKGVSITLGLPFVLIVDRSRARHSSGAKNAQSRMLTSVCADASMHRWRGAERGRGCLESHRCELDTVRLRHSANSCSNSIACRSKPCRRA
jgi:hypothetical protein